jgi:hypothetical protein
MSVLDAYFGTATAAPPLQVRKTEFPRAPEELRPILDAFLVEVRRRAGQDYRVIDVWSKRWLAGARELIRVLPKGANVDDFMAWAFEQFERSFPDQRPISPKSIMYLTTRYKPRVSFKDLPACPECGALYGGHGRHCSQREDE